MIDKRGWHNGRNWKYAKNPYPMNIQAIFPLNGKRISFPTWLSFHYYASIILSDGVKKSTFSSGKTRIQRWRTHWCVCVTEILFTPGKGNPGNVREVTIGTMNSLDLPSSRFSAGCSIHRCWYLSLSIEWIVHGAQYIVLESRYLRWRLQYS